MNNNINFTGGFLLRNIDGTTLDKIYDEIVPKRRIILQDLYEKGDFFFATKSCYDKEVSEYLLKNNFKFFYYPKINLKLRLDARRMEETLEKINASIVITDKDEILKQSSKFLPTQKSMHYRWKENDHIQQTLTALKLEENNVDITTKNHLTVIKEKGKDGKLIAKVSPNNDKGISYAMVYPAYDDEDMLYMSINYKGEILSSTKDIDNLKGFIKNFKNAMKIDAGRTRPNLRV